MIKKIIKVTAIFLILLIILLSAVFLIGAQVVKQHVKTPMFTDASGRVLPESIAEFSRVSLGGYKQAVLIRGKNINNPILLFLHGGPGSSELAPLRKYNSILEEHFTVVYWEQRGAGKSFSLFLDGKTMKIDQFVSDTIELVNLLRIRFNKDKIFLAGHSWGSALGIIAVSRNPGLFYAYVGIGQVADMKESEKLSLDFTINEAVKDNNKKALKELYAIKEFPPKSIKKLKDVGAQRKWLLYYGGAIYGKKDYGLLFDAVNIPEYNAFDMINFFAGSMYSLFKMWLELNERGDLMSIYREIKVPVYFMLGRHDYNVSAALSEKYFNLLKAPKKELFWFEKSAHMPCFEEADKFNDIMINIVLKEAKN